MVGRRRRHRRKGQRVNYVYVLRVLRQRFRTGDAPGGSSLDRPPTERLFFTQVTSLPSPAEERLSGADVEFRLRIDRSLRH